MREFKVDNINTLKIAGIHSILGVDYYQDTIRVVELRSRGGVFNKFRAVYKVVNYFKFQLPIDASNFERGRLLFDELKTRGVHCRFCVSTVRSSTMKVVTAELPEDAENINEWISENYERLLKVPVNFRDLSFGYRVHSSAPLRCEVAFVHVSERDGVVEMINVSGLHLLGLGLGAWDFEAASIAGSSEPTDQVLAFADDDEFICSTFQKDRPISRRRFQGGGTPGAVSFIKGEVVIGGMALVTGPKAQEFDDSLAKRLDPLGLPAEFALAAGLAIRGFIPEIGAFESRPEAVIRKSTEEKDKTLLKSTALVLGGVLTVLFGLQLGLQSYLLGISKGLDGKLAKNGSVYSQIRNLEEEVNSLNMEIPGEKANGQRSAVAKALHEVAAATPLGVWLYNLEYNDGGTINLSGYARTDEEAAQYFTSLGRDPNFSNVQVLRVGNPTELEAASFMDTALKSFVTFRVSMVAEK
ncbi:MAG: PilN domain-containing protein [Bacteroidetes bacterium]|nr:PilN domain-containing protein [Bacteroidota bacterium]